MTPTKFATLAVAALAFLVLPMTAAQAGGPPADAALAAVAVPGSFRAGYATPALAVPVGEDVTFYNFDIAAHNVVALDAFGSDDEPWCGSYPAGECPLFWSALIGFNAQTPVLGMENLQEGGMYTYFCTLHPWMTGTLVALPPVA